jgi:hypothetical protein
MLVMEQLPRPTISSTILVSANLRDIPPRGRQGLRYTLPRICFALEPNHQNSDLSNAKPQYNRKRFHHIGPPMMLEFKLFPQELRSSHRHSQVRI